MEKPRVSVILRRDRQVTWHPRESLDIRQSPSLYYKSHERLGKKSALQLSNHEHVTFEMHPNTPSRKTNRLQAKHAIDER